MFRNYNKKSEESFICNDLNIYADDIQAIQIVNKLIRAFSFRDNNGLKTLEIYNYLSLFFEEDLSTYFLEYLIDFDYEQKIKAQKQQEKDNKITKKANK